MFSCDEKVASSPTKTPQYFQTAAEEKPPLGEMKPTAPSMFNASAAVGAVWFTVGVLDDLTIFSMASQDSVA